MPAVETSGAALGKRLESVLVIATRHAAEVDAEARFPAEAVTELRRSGLLGLTVPVEHGGLGAGPLEFADAVSRLAQACGSTAMVYLMHVSAVMPVVAAPPTGLPGLARVIAEGKMGTLAFSERGSRSHFWTPVSKSVAAKGSAPAESAQSLVTTAGP